MKERTKFAGNSNIIYGVEVTKDFTPVKVKDALIQCFYKAYCNVLELAKHTFGHLPERKFEEMKKVHVKELVQDIFVKIEGDLNNPTKVNLLKVLDNLKSFASIYRKPNVIKKHVSGIMLLINKLD